MPAWSGLRAADIHVVRCQPLRFPTWCRQLRSGERTRPVSGHLRRTGVRRPYPQAYPTAALAVPKLQLALELLLASRRVYQAFSLTVRAWNRRSKLNKRVRFPSSAPLLAWRHARTSFSFLRPT